MFCPVMPPMALMWPRFSATRISATGAISSMAEASKLGLWKVGAPNQGAAASSVKSMAGSSPRPLPRTSTAR